MPDCWRGMQETSLQVFGRERWSRNSGAALERKRGMFSRRSDAMVRLHTTLSMSPRARYELARPTWNPYPHVHPVNASYLEGLRLANRSRRVGQSLLLLFLGSTIGNFERESAEQFLADVRALLRPGDAMLIGADLVKPVPRMLAAYDDEIGVTAAFNKNLLARMNRELAANFDLRRFTHEVRWDARHRRIEMHLRSFRRSTSGDPFGRPDRHVSRGRDDLDGVVP